MENATTAICRNGEAIMAYSLSIANIYAVSQKRVNFDEPWF